MRKPLHFLSYIPIIFTITLQVCLANDGEIQETSGTSAPANIQTPYYTKAGPWGRLQCYKFFLEAPEILTSKFRLPSPVSRWSIPRSELSRISLLFEAAGLDSEFVKALLDPARMTLTQATAHLFPPPSMLENMTPETRSKVYAYLAKFPDNEFHTYPVFFLTSTVDEWAADSGLPAHLVDVLKKYAYNQGTALAFSDPAVLVRSSRSDEEARLVARKMTRIPTVFARLEVTATTDLPSVLNYWSTGLGLRRKELEPLLVAVQRTHGINYLDLLHLLPPLARKHLYTYPGTDLALMGRLPDCHWSTLNFFNASAEHHFLDERLATTAILANFDRVQPPYRFGDILMFVTSEDIAKHSCNYIADDLVYTKNGTSLTQPFMLMHLADLGKLYGVDTNEVRVIGFRHKASDMGAE